jgi:arginase
VAFVFVGVPIDCVGAPAPDADAFGCELSPAVLRSAGIAEGFDDGGDLPVRLIGQERDAATGVKAWPAVASTTSAVRSAASSVIADGDVPVMLGGCCTLLPGALAGARDVVGSVGLAYFDGHLDMYDGSTSTTGEPADMPIAVITGVGPEPWVSLVGGPLVSPTQLALIGPRDRDEAVSLSSALPEQVGASREATPEAIRSLGIATVASTASSTVGPSYWVHLDVDVLDQEEFRATDYLTPGGLRWSELTSLMSPLVRGAGLVGMSVACYNPSLDPDGVCGARLSGMVRSLLT